MTVGDPTQEGVQVKRILILGCGYVSNHCIKYLASRPGNNVTVVARTCHNLNKTSRIFFDNLNVRFYNADVAKDKELDFFIPRCDLVISLVPYTLHPLVFKVALKYKKNVVTTSYISEKMMSYDDAVMEQGLIFYNEVGVDPGIDHIYAMKVLNDIKNEGGEVESYTSYCGGLPKLDHSYDNPLRYKFSWSSQGVLMALKNNAKLISDGKLVEIPAENLMDSCRNLEIDSNGQHYSLIGYPNRNSSFYTQRYNIQNAKEVIRGTLRFPEFSVYVKLFHKLNLLDTDVNYLQKILKDIGPETATWSHLLAHKLNCKPNYDDIMCAIGKLGIVKTEEDLAKLVEGLKFLRLISDDKVDGSDTLLGCVAYCIEPLMLYNPGEADIVALIHKFVVKYTKPALHKKIITCSAVWIGKSSTDTAMGKTVGVTCGITAQLILDGKITKCGVLAPVSWELAAPIHAELVKEGITMDETSSII